MQHVEKFTVKKAYKFEKRKYDHISCSEAITIQILNSHFSCVLAVKEVRAFAMILFSTVQNFGQRNYEIHFESSSLIFYFLKNSSIFILRERFLVSFE